MISNMDDMQKLTQSNMDTAMRMYGDWTRSCQAIAVEMQDYAKRAMEENAQTMERLMSCKSLDQVLTIQQSYAKRAYEDYMHQCTKLGTMYNELAKEATKPLERLSQASR